jgi:nucleoside-diphosphate-sugar epimerase
MRLVPLLVSAGHAVTGTTRSPARAAQLAALGAQPAIVDVFDAAALKSAVKAAHPRIVIHQLTDLALLASGDRNEAVARNARIRVEGTRNLVAAAIAAGAQKLISQSIAWVYAPGPEPHAEDDPLSTPAEGAAGATLRGVIALEQQTLESPPLVGTVLRYGRLYGPGTGSDTPAEGAPGLHVDAAAWAAVLAAQSSAHGIFNIAEPSDQLLTGRAERELGWDAGFRTPTAGAAIS